MQCRGLVHHAGNFRCEDFHAQLLVRVSIFDRKEGRRWSLIQHGQFVQIVLGGKELRKLGHGRDVLK